MRRTTARASCPPCASQPCTFASQVLLAGRRDRGTGEFDSRNVFRAICELHEEGRYEGFAALEDRPSGPGPERWPKHANWQLHGRFSGQGDSVRAHGRPAATGRPNTRADGQSSDGCLGAPLGQPPRESSRHAGQPHGSAAKAGRAAPQEQDSDGDSQGSIRCAGFRARPSRREGQERRRDDSWDGRGPRRNDRELRPARRRHVPKCNAATTELCEQFAKLEVPVARRGVQSWMIGTLVAPLALLALAHAWNFHILQ